MQTRAARRLLEEVDSHGGAVTGNTVFIVEHDPVYTVGIRSKDYRGEIEEKLRRLGADFVRTNRGGLITFHGPGQLVAYPVLHLGSFFRDKSMRRYVCSLEKMIIDVCARFQLEAKTTEHTGVWIGDNKIAAIGKLPFITLFPFPLCLFTNCGSTAVHAQICTLVVLAILLHEMSAHVVPQRPLLMGLGAM